MVVIPIPSRHGLPRRAHGFATGGQCRAGANVVGIAFTSCIATIFKPLATGFASLARPAQVCDPVGD